ncbi:MAG: protein-L-isoaspartate O-methyltransferase [Francisellaceae bacterium]|jgi:protein-L-isoaspartate(D-aspartate) O-methyltransferase|nr:protein-L-isoaspartate O-methyltransferase [Francisellaceae bacterium]MBT6206886.1 protein-L-isoaspartate O-methyltransferase [Francisellaceae bacterium]MBT6538959.1 protein-L-isoaspartate O-methyltransferase [Francisellaceae bacterium]
MSSTVDLSAAKEKMLSHQLRAWGVQNPRVLEVIRKVPKEIFLNKDICPLAYSDTGLDIGNNQFSLAPKIVGRILEAVNIGTRDDILEIGTGSGYLSALAAELGFHITSLDIHKNFVEKTRVALSSLRLSNFHLLQSDIFEYIKEKNKVFDVIILTGSIPAMIPDILELLNFNGRLFAIIGHKPAMNACLWSKGSCGAIIKTNLFETVVEPLENYPVKEKFLL